MSFGFSVGDILLAGQLAWSLYKSCKGAGGAFEELSQEVISLHTVIREVQDEIDNPDSILNRSSADKKKALGILIRHCNGVLQQLNKLLLKYESLGTKSKRTWDRLRWGTENLAEVRDKIMLNTSSLTAFLTTLGTGSLGRIEKKLDQLIKDVRAGRREGTVLTMAEDNEDGADVQWDLWKAELMKDGLTKVELESHKHMIKAKLAELIANGHLQEGGLPERPKSSKATSPNEPGTEASSSKSIPLQATVEDADEDDDGRTVLPREKPRESVDSAIPGTAQGQHHVAESPNATDEELDSGDIDASSDDTCLPEDSISNVGLNVPSSHVPRPSSAPSAEQSKNEGLKERPRSSSGAGRETGNAPNDLDAIPLTTSNDAPADGSTRPEQQVRRPRRRYPSPGTTAEPSGIRSAYDRVGRSEALPKTLNQGPPIDQPQISTIGNSRHGTEERPGTTQRSRTQRNRRVASEMDTSSESETSITTEDLRHSRGRGDHRRTRARSSSPTLDALRGQNSKGRSVSPTFEKVPYVPRYGLEDTTYTSHPREQHSDEDLRRRNGARGDPWANETPTTASNHFAPRYYPRQDEPFRARIRSIEEAWAKLDQLKAKLQDCTRKGDSVRAADLQYYDIPGQEALIKRLEKGNASADARDKSIQESKVKLEQLRRKLKAYTRNGDSASAADLQYYAIPEQEEYIKALEKEKATADAALNSRSTTPPQFSTTPSSNIFSSGDGRHGFTFSDPKSIFAEFLRGQTRTTEGPAETFEDMFGSAGRSTKVPRQDVRKEDEPEPEIIERPLALTLEELFKGTHKKMNIKLKAFDEVTGKRTTQDRVLEMDIKPGLKKGSKIKFKGVGDQQEGRCQDLHFIVEEKPHPLFHRDQDDIYFTLQLSLRESLCGWKRSVSTIDSKTIVIEKSNPTSPGSKDIYPGLGMPNSRKSGEHGDFIVTYAVKYPASLTRQQRAKIEELFKPDLI